MNNKAFSYVELIVAITLFFIVIIPNLFFLNKAVKFSNIYSSISEHHSNFSILVEQFNNLDFEILSFNIGHHYYTAKTIGFDDITNGFTIPYNTLNFQLEININKNILYSQNSNYDFFPTEIKYTTKNKTFSTIIFKVGEKLEKK